MRVLSTGFNSELGHFTERKQFYIGNFINVNCVFKLKAWDILSCCPEHYKHQKFKTLLCFSSRTKAPFMNMQFTVTSCLRPLLLSLQNNYFVNYNQYRFFLGKKGLSEHPLDGVQLLHGVTRLLTAPIHLCSRLFLKKQHIHLY